MTPTDLLALLPLLVIAASALLALALIAVWRHHLTIAGVTLGGLAVAGLTLGLTLARLPRFITPLLVLDLYGVVFMGVLIASSFVVAVLAYGYLDGRAGHREEFYVLHLLATLGALTLVISNHFAAFVLGLELLSVSLYALIAYGKTEARPLEAGIKYLLLAGASSAFLLFGMALVYAELGTLEFGQMAQALTAGVRVRSAIVLMGLAMLVTGIGFKMAVVPFHMWTPDVYEGSPAPVTAFIATVSKGAVAALLLRYVMQSGAYAYETIVLVFSLMAAFSMMVGNLLALLQQNVKRLLAYSSIAHLGYLLVAFVAGAPRASEAVIYYVVAYVVTTLVAFGCVTVISESSREAETLNDYRGLFWRRPGLAVVLTAALFSLAGIPFTAGFLGKFYVLVAGVESALWLLVFLVILSSAIGLFYYLRLVVTLYAPLSPEGAALPRTGLTAASWAGSAALAVLAVILVWLGVYPVPFLTLIRLTVASAF